MKYIIEFRDNPVQNFDKENMYKCLDVPCWYISEDTKKTLTPYTEPDKNVKNNDVNLCNSCVCNFPDCLASEEDVLYGDSEGFDNICCCLHYIPKNYYNPESKDRKQIENEVWAFVRFMFQVMDSVDRLECFGSEGLGYASANSVLRDMTYQEAKARYEAWKKQKEEIRAGDECFYDGQKCVVNYIGHDDGCRIMAMLESGETYYNIDIDELTPTGKHYPQLEEMFKQMRGE